MTISKELLDDLLKGCERPEDLPGDAGLMKELKIRLMERLLRAELTAHSGYEEGKDTPRYARFWVIESDQAARFLVSFAATPSVNVTPSMTKGNWFAPFRRRHVFPAA